MSLYIPDVPIVDFEVQDRVRDRMQSITQTTGGLGILEVLALRLAAITGRTDPSFPRKSLVIMAADSQPASDFDKDTQAVVQAILDGSHALNALARQAGVVIQVADVGMKEMAKFNDPGGRLESYRVTNGGNNILERPALGLPQVNDALMIGMNIASLEISRGVDLMLLGSIGSGLESAAAATVAALTGKSPSQMFSPNDHRIKIVEAAINAHQPEQHDPLDVLRCVGGINIAAVAGLVLASAAGRKPIVIDNFATAAGALIAASLSPAVRPYLVAGHLTPLPGHTVVLRQLGLRPLLNLGIESPAGTGSLLASHIIEACARTLNEGR